MNKNIILFCVLIIFMVGDCVAMDVTGWNYQKDITIDHSKVNGTQTNFPILVSLTDTDLAAHAQNDGDDILFTNTTDTKLDHGIEVFNGTTGVLVTWIRIPSLSGSTNTTIRMYYGNSSSSNQENMFGVWDSNFVVVHHLKETDIDGGSGDIKDSTRNGNNGTTYDMQTSDQVAGKIDGSFDLTGADGRCVNTSVSNGGTHNTVTISGWASADTKANYRALALHRATAGRGLILTSATDKPLGYLWEGGADEYAANTGLVMNIGELYFVAVVIEPTKATVYLNDTYWVNTKTHNTKSLDVEWRWGDDSAASGRYWDGILDDIKISNTSRSMGWMTTEFANQGSPSSFYDVGVQQYLGGTPYPTTLTHSKGETWVNHTWAAGTAPNVTDSYNVSVNSTWHNTTTNAYYNNTPIPNGNWSNITVYAWNSTYSELSSGSVSENVQTSSAAAGAPDITSSGYTDNLWPEVYDSKTFNLTGNQTTEGRWYINGTLKQTNATPSLTHAYTNTSLEGGHWNFSAVVNNTNGSDIQTWNFEAGADSVTHIVLQDTPTNKTCIAEENITRIGTNVTDWGINLTYTFDEWNYSLWFINGTYVSSGTASSNNDSVYLNGTNLLPIGVYFVNATSGGLTANANQYFLFNNWTIDQTFSQIAANESNDICISWYNHTSGLHEAYYVGRDYNANAIIPANCSVFTFFDAQTNIAVTPRTT